MTTALVLAAGLGRRLRTVTDGPKWLVSVGATSPMEQQLGAIRATPHIDRLIVVTSGDATGVRAGLSRHVDHLAVEIVDNPDADRWNNWSSALLGLEAVGAEDVVLFNSDLFASADWLRDAVVSISTRRRAALLIDGERPLTDEAMKVCGSSTITGIGKTGVDDPVGEYVGVAWWPKGTTGPILDILRGYRHDSSAAQNWYEHAILDDLRFGSIYERVDVPSVDWVEIDDPVDLAAAVALAG